MNAIDEVLAKLSGKIIWENWATEETQKDGSPVYMKVTEVLYSRLEWMRDLMNEDEDENAEHIETIDMVQQLLAAIKSKSN